MEESMRRTLVTFHSRSGNTRRIAQALARRLDGDLDEIRIVQPLKGALGYAMCAIEAIACLTPALRPAGKDPAAYDLVVIGTPVWFWSLSSPVRSWLESHPMGKRRVAFFCTMGASGASRVFATMQSLAGRKPVATLALTEREARAGDDRKIDAFVSSLASSREQGRLVRSPVVHAGA
jgi:flavodoxin